MKVTVIVPVYNIAKHLPRFFDSMRNQTYKDYCLLVVDDGSTDASLQICNEYAAMDSRIEVIAAPHAGVIKARDIAMQHVTTEYVAYADGDDYVEKGYLQHLMDAVIKYNADLSISRVVYRTENNIEQGSFPQRGEKLISRDKFAEELPMLFDDRRLNYLYGKIYRTRLLKNIHVEDDVKQGSDTMINCQYLANIQNIVLIDDLDYNYIKYKSRSITSYSGSDSYERLCRINSYAYNAMEKNGWLTKEMIKVIDGRILLSAIWCIERMYEIVLDNETRIEGITAILKHPLYLQAYNRQADKKVYPFVPVVPQNGTRYVRKREKSRKRAARKGWIIAHSPQFILKVYRKLKRR